MGFGELGNILIFFFMTWLFFNKFSHLVLVYISIGVLLPPQEILARILLEIT